MSDIGEKYFQFPLCALSYGKDPYQRFNYIVDYGCYTAGLKMLNRIPPEFRHQKAEEFVRSFSGYRKNKTEDVAFALGAQQLNINYGSNSNIADILERVRVLLDFKRRFEQVHKPDVEVRIATQLVFEVRDKKGMTYREFSVLAALYSRIGAKKYPVRVTRDCIQCRALGYKSPVIMATELPNRMDGAKPLSLHQINYTLDALHERKFFARARANKRQTYYSHRMPQEQLEQALISSKTYSQQFHQKRRQRDSELIEKISQAKAAIKVNGLLK